MGLAEEFAASLVQNSAEFAAAAEEELIRSGRARASFQWGGAISAIFLLILNRTGRRSAMQTTLLVTYLFICFPSVFFKILRGQFGYWIAFIAVVAHLFFPETFPASRFILFVITPTWLADGIRDGIAGGVFCLIIGISLVVTEIQGVGGLRNCGCNLRCFGFFLGIASLFFFTTLYLSLGT